MGHAKPWQIVLMVAALVAVGITLFRAVSGGSDGGPLLADSIRMVDVNTGEEFRLRIGGPGGASIPGKNPKTEQETLMPVEERDGALFITERYLAALKNIPGDHAAVDPKTGQVRAKP